jgi:selenocysteine lyase/cysteine desulfurase
MLDLGSAFRTFIDADPSRVHFAAHSHHYWPDAAFAGHARAVADAARLADCKWEAVFGEVIPELQRHIAGILGLTEGARHPGDSIAFAPNTHEFVRRLFSLFPAGQPLRILTTDSEFHSFSRQTARLEEEGLAVAARVPAEPFGSFTERLAAAATAGFDIAFVSHVFFNSGGVAGSVDDIVNAVADRAEVVVIDGYHSFMALPLDLSRIAGRAFFLSGGYKYAMAGEGACFIHVPPGQALRPRDTGWFASFGTLQAKQDAVPYADDGARFLGATFDPSGLYRQRAVLDWLEREGVTVADIHGHVMGLQDRFLGALAAEPIAGLDAARLITPVGVGVERGHFLTFEWDGAAAMQEKLMAADIITDRRDRRLRFGFGCYHARADIDAGVAAMRRALA